MKPAYQPPDIKCEFLEHYDNWDLWYCPGPIPDLIAITVRDYGRIIEKGLERGRSGECQILAVAYGIAKTLGKHKDHYEQEFITNSAIGYLVMGRTGEYDDKQLWPVFFTLNRERAEKCRMVLNDQADSWVQGRDNCYIDPPHGWSQIDPNMKVDHTGTQYFVQPIKHEADPRRVSFASEICPECNSQVYDTPHGMICERGHSL